MIAFGVKGGRAAGEAFINAVKLASNLANVGDSKTLVIHPASTTHAQMDTETMKLAGLTEDMIRLSVGIEDVEDIINDFDNGFRAARSRNKAIAKSSAYILLSKTLRNHNHIRLTNQTDGVIRRSCISIP